MNFADIPLNCKAAYGKAHFVVRKLRHRETWLSQMLVVAVETELDPTILSYFCCYSMLRHRLNVAKRNTFNV